MNDPDDRIELDREQRVRAGAEHLRAAAKEVIAASRAFLDVAEDLVDDPDAIGDLVEAASEIARQFRSRGAGPSPTQTGPSGEPTSDPPPGRVRRITVD